MEKIFIVALIITGIFVALKLAEMRFIQGEIKPLKETIRDAGMVFISAFSAEFINQNFSKTMSEWFSVVTESKVLENIQAQVFTDKPDF